MEKQQLLQKLCQTNLLPLAFLGDSIHTMFVRERILQTAENKMTNYHTVAASFCKASAQRQALERLQPLLNEQEKDIVRRARNAHPKHSAKNASSHDYAQATAFEALIGYLYLSENSQRLEQFLEISMQKE